jgi:HTH-type transcriptional regulator/antitoxin HigA
MDVSPVEAIRVRLEQLALPTSELTTILGTRARVSEVLSGRRGLSTRMIRELSARLGLPADILLGSESKPTNNKEGSEPPSAIPVREILRRKWVPNGDALSPTEFAARLFAPLGEPWRVQVSFRSGISGRALKPESLGALTAWLAQVARLATISAPSSPDTVTPSLSLARDIASLSVNDDGPSRAINALARAGIAVVTLAPLNKMSIDGAAVALPDGRPVIGLTLRHDRLDNFWFTLLHELAHISLHFSSTPRVFADDIEARLPDESADEMEREADAFAAESLVPTSLWERSAAARLPTPSTVRLLATQLGVSPAVVAGRARFARRNYRMLTELVGHGRVRVLFPDFQRELMGEE